MRNVLYACLNGLVCLAVLSRTVQDSITCVDDLIVAVWTALLS